MDSFNQAKAGIASLLSENANIGIVVSEHQTIDVLAAALSLHLIFQDSGKNSQVVSKKDPIVEHSFLVGVDQLKKQFEGSTKTLTVSFPYHDGDIEKVSYNIEGDKLNVNLFADEQGIRFSEKDIKYIRDGSAPQLVFTIGITNPLEFEGILDGSSKIINIDNSISNTLFGEMQLVDATYSSLSEVVAKLASDLSLQVEFDVAQNLLDGISFATQNFSSPKTSPLAFEMVGFLMKKGAIRKSMKDTRPITDTSLSMLNNKPQPQQQQQKPFNGQKPFQKGFNQKFQPKPQPFNQPQQPRPMQSPQPQFVQQQQSPFMPQQPQEQPFPQQMPSQAFEDEFIQNEQPKPQPFSQPMTQQQSKPQQPQPIQQDNFPPMPQEEAPLIPTEDEAPSDWFTPKVFKSTKNQQ